MSFGSFAGRLSDVCEAIASAESQAQFGSVGLITARIFEFHDRKQRMPTGGQIMSNPYRKSAKFEFKYNLR